MHHNQRQINWSQYECQTRMVIHSQHYAVHHNHETKGRGAVHQATPRRSEEANYLGRKESLWRSNRCADRHEHAKFYPPRRVPHPPTNPDSRSLQIHSQYSPGGAPARQPSCFGGEDHGDRCVGMIATNRFFRVPSKPPPFLRSPSPASTDRSHLSYRPTRPQVWLPSAAPLAKSCRILKKGEGFRMYSSSGSASVFGIDRLSPISGNKAGGRGCQRVRHHWPSYRRNPFNTAHRQNSHARVGSGQNSRMSPEIASQGRGPPALCRR